MSARRLIPFVLAGIALLAPSDTWARPRAKPPAVSPVVDPSLEPDQVPPMVRRMPPREDKAWYGKMQAAKAAFDGGDAATAADLYAPIVVHFRQTFGPRHPVTAGLLDLEALARLEAGCIPDALTAAQEAQAIWQGYYGEDNVHTALGDRFLGVVEAAQGDLEAARVLLAKAADIWDKQRDGITSRAEAHIDLAQILARLARYDEAEAELTKVKPWLEASPGSDGLVARRLAVLGRIYVDEGRYPEAQPLLLDALKRQTALDDADGTRETLNALGLLYIYDNRSPLAVQVLEKARQMGTRPIERSTPDDTSILNNLAVAYEDSGALDKAEPLFNAVLNIRESAGSPEDMASTLNNLAELHADLGHLDQAIQDAKRAKDLIVPAVGADNPFVATLLANLANYEFNTGDFAGSERDIAAAVAILEKRHDTAILAKALSLQASGLQHDGKTGLAVAAARRAVALVKARGDLRARGGDGNGMGAALARMRALSQVGVNDPQAYVLANFVAIAGARASAAPGEAAALARESFGVAQDATASPAGLAMQQAAARRAGTPAQAELARAQQDLTARAGADDRALSKAVDAADAKAIAAATQALSNDTDALAAAERKLAAGFPAYAGLVSPQALAVADVQARLAPDQGLLFVMADGDNVQTYAVTRTDFKWSTLEHGQAALKARVARLLCQIDADTCAKGTAPEDPAAFDQAAAFALYQDLIAPFGDQLAGVRRLYTVTPGALGGLPLGVLVTQDPSKTGPDLTQDLTRTHWLADRFAVTVLPSVAALALPVPVRAPASGAAFAGYGNPLLQGGTQDDRAADVTLDWFEPAGAGLLANPDRFRTLPPLPGTGRELNRVAAQIGVFDPGLIHTGKSDDEAAFKHDPALATARIVSIATHGILPSAGQGDIEPGLVFTPPATPTAEDDGYLTASEVVAQSFGADWVILSACNTATATDGADALSGLSRAFLFAGADSLLASHWRVSDDATAELIGATLGAYAKGHVSRAQALQAAMASVRRMPSYAHPRYWAPFSVIANADTVRP